MVGTGVFTSLGYQLLDVQDTISIVLLWVIGGAMALFGAFSYGQLGTHFAESGGDYLYLSRIFHPVLGYLSSWVSLLVGLLGSRGHCRHRHDAVPGPLWRR